MFSIVFLATFEFWRGHSSISIRRSTRLILLSRAKGSADFTICSNFVPLIEPQNCSQRTNSFIIWHIYHKGCISCTFSAPFGNASITLTLAIFFASPLLWVPLPCALDWFCTRIICIKIYWLIFVFIQAPSFLLCGNTFYAFSGISWSGDNNICFGLYSSWQLCYRHGLFHCQTEHALKFSISMSYGLA